VIDRQTDHPSSGETTVSKRNNGSSIFGLCTALLTISLFCGDLCAAPPARIGPALPSHPAKIVYDSLDWEVPLGEPYRNELKNGAVAYIATDSTLPFVKVTAYVAHGSLVDPKGKEGLASLAATMLRSGGTGKFPADTLEELLALFALQFGFTASQTQFTFSGAFLSEYLDTAFAIMEEMFFRPAFSEQKLEKERRIMIEAVKHRFDDPGPILGAAFQKCMYPRQSAGRMSTEASIRSITRNDLIKLHSTLFSPSKVIFCISGAFDSGAMKERLERFFRQKNAPADTSLFPRITVNRTPSAMLVHKELSQAYVSMGLPLFQRPHPDYYPVVLLNEVLGGGGFTSRLGKSVRSDEGLTYSIYSVAESNYTYPGTFRITFFTKNTTFARAVELTLAEVTKAVESGVTEEELANARATLVGELPSMFRTSDDIVSTYGWNEYYRRAPDHFRVYPQKLMAVTREDVLRAARTYLRPDSMSFVVVGDSTALLHQKSGEFSLKKLSPRTLVPAEVTKLP